MIGLVGLGGIGSCTDPSGFVGWRLLPTRPLDRPGGPRRPCEFASTLGWGVAASGLSVLVYQGGLTVLAAVLQHVMTPAVVAAMTAVGGLLVIAIGLRLLGLARIRVTNLLPAVLLAPLATGLLTVVQRP
jgi:hypothetical protein